MSQRGRPRNALPSIRVAIAGWLNPEYDADILAQNLGYRPDDDNNDIAHAKPLTVAGGVSVSACASTSSYCTASITIGKDGANLSPITLRLSKY